MHLIHARRSQEMIWLLLDYCILHYPLHISKQAGTFSLHPLSLTPFLSKHERIWKAPNHPHDSFCLWNRVITMYKSSYTYLHILFWGSFKKRRVGSFHLPRRWKEFHVWHQVAPAPEVHRYFATSPSIYIYYIILYYIIVYYIILYYIIYYIIL